MTDPNKDPITDNQNEDIEKFWVKKSGVLDDNTWKIFTERSRRKGGPYTRKSVLPIGMASVAMVAGRAIIPDASVH